MKKLKISFLLIASILSPLDLFFTPQALAKKNNQTKYFETKIDTNLDGFADYIIYETIDSKSKTTVGFKLGKKYVNEIDVTLEKSNLTVHARYAMKTNQYELVYSDVNLDSVHFQALPAINTTEGTAECAECIPKDPRIPMSDKFSNILDITRVLNPVAEREAAYNELVSNFPLDRSCNRDMRNANREEDFRKEIYDAILDISLNKEVMGCLMEEGQSTLRVGFSNLPKSLYETEFPYSNLKLQCANNSETCACNTSNPEACVRDNCLARSLKNPRTKESCNELDQDCTMHRTLGAYVDLHDNGRTIILSNELKIKKNTSERGLARQRKKLKATLAHEMIHTFGCKNECQTSYLVDKCVLGDGKDSDGQAVKKKRKCELMERMAEKKRELEKSATEDNRPLAIDGGDHIASYNKSSVPNAVEKAEVYFSEQGRRGQKGNQSADNKDKKSESVKRTSSEENSGIKAVSAGIPAVDKELIKKDIESSIPKSIPTKPLAVSSNTVAMSKAAKANSSGTNVERNEISDNRILKNSKTSTLKGIAGEVGSLFSRSVASVGESLIPKADAREVKSPTPVIEKSNNRVDTITKTAKKAATQNINVQSGNRQVASENNTVVPVTNSRVGNSPQGNLSFSEGNAPSNVVGRPMAPTSQSGTVGTSKQSILESNNFDTSRDGNHASVWSVPQLQNIVRNPGTITGNDYFSFRESLQSKEFVDNLSQQGIKVVNPSARVGERQELGATKNPRITCVDMGNRYRCQRNAR